MHIDIYESASFFFCAEKISTYASDFNYQQRILKVPTNEENCYPIHRKSPHLRGGRTILPRAKWRQCPPHNNCNPMF